VTSEILHTHEPYAAARGLHVDASLGDAMVSGDPRLLHQLVSNLVDNAIRYNISDGRLQVILTASTTEATLIVTNTGLPVAPDQVSRLIQPFQRGTPDRTANPDGLGLGLSIVADVARAHGAGLEILPRPDGGLTITVSFPADSTIRSQGGRQLTPV
jgi:signal transduction histidine kinase